MIKLQSDLIDIHNSLVVFNDRVIVCDNPKPIKVWFDITTKSLGFEVPGISLRLSTLNYYCLDLEELEEPTYLLPEDYDKLMYDLNKLISSGKLLEDRVCLSPENWGFNVFWTNPKELEKGPDILGKVRFISGKSWLFKLKTKLKYNL